MRAIFQLGCQSFFDISKNTKNHGFFVESGTLGVSGTRPPMYRRGFPISALQQFGFQALLRASVPTVRLAGGRC